MIYHTLKERPGSAGREVACKAKLRWILYRTALIIPGDSPQRIPVSNGRTCDGSYLYLGIRILLYLGLSSDDPSQPGASGLDLSTTDAVSSRLPIQSHLGSRFPKKLREALSTLRRDHLV